MTLLHRTHPWIGFEVEDTATGTRGILRAVAPDMSGPAPLYGRTPRPVAWLRPPGGGQEWTTDPEALADPSPVTPV
ncbi:hypothetical protein [Streptomyces albidoflavus]|uniref:hypothetical protein n=1 Tax=Streptomyces albidoflavus TaxID=1886 RepID=UPI0010216BF4|nr:hypothetical protein [Streptomyces albidoflavus]RZF02923.1 hypothetical protein C0R05_32450 [Streptomyces albidoflavus]